jgi:hypothetical protein
MAKGQSVLAREEVRNFEDYLREKSVFGHQFKLSSRGWPASEGWDPRERKFLNLKYKG